MITLHGRHSAYRSYLLILLFALLITAVGGLRGFAQDNNGSGGQNYFSHSIDPLKISVSPLPSGKVGVPYSAKLAATGGTLPYSWSLMRGELPTGLGLNSSTGVISGTPVEAVTSDFLTFKVRDSSHPEERKSVSFTLTITPAAETAVSIATPLPAATEKVAYSQQLVATGGSGSYSWTLTTPVTGFSLSTTGLLTGTPTSTTALSFAVKATDTANSSNFGTATLKLTVNAAETAVSITTTLPAATEKVAYSQQLAATGGSGSYSWTLTTPVTGFSLSATGLLTGTPTSTTALSFAVKATDTANSSNFGTATLTLTVNAASSGSAFYVSTSGSDSNAGTILSPWKTIQHAADSVQAGDTVYVRAGTYNESVTIAVSGSTTAGSVIFQNYPGETAIVDGTGLTPSSSSTQGLFNIEDESYVTIQGFTIQNYTTSNANASPAGIWVTGSGSYIQILNNTVTNITTTSEAQGNAFGIAVYGSEAPAAISYITISGNTVYNCKTGNSETVNVDGNVTNFTITSNTIHD
ncbi:MAG: putative Ig domain-containing protein, partial [Candidatus Acidiferrum sp.]